jgi:hypothetical protein
MHNLPLSGTGTIQKGKFHGKVILIESGMDEAAFPWQAEWYRMQVKKNYGAQADEKFRLWMVDRCMHTSPSPLAPGESKPAESTRIVSYTGVIQQALRDLTQWVEKGIAPPPNTNYTVSDGQILLPPLASQRLGVQPVVRLLANKGPRADIKVGSTVEFRGTVSIPPNTGKIVQTEFDIEGDGTFPIVVPLATDGETSATVSYSHTFTKPGTYFPALRGVSQGSSNLSSPFGRAANLGRVRIVVT